MYEEMKTLKNMNYLDEVERPPDTRVLHQEAFLKIRGMRPVIYKNIRHG